MISLILSIIKIVFGAEIGDLFSYRNVNKHIKKQVKRAREAGRNAAFKSSREVMKQIFTENQVALFYGLDIPTRSK